ncbi:MAG: hypothetical protein AAF701_01625 [Pseudomonadota bacterium]
MVTLFDPAHANDRDACKQAFQNAGLIVADRHIEGEPNAVTQVFFTDGPGEDPLWYRLATLVYMGGTLTGQAMATPLVPASLGCTVLHGPNLTPNRPVYEPLIQAQATVSVGHGRKLGTAIATTLAPDAAAATAQAAWDITTAGAEATDEIIEYLCDRLSLTFMD